MHPQLVQLMVIVGAVVLIAGALSWSYRAVGGLALSDRRGTATVVGKEFRLAGWVNHTEVIGGRPQNISHSVPDRYMLRLVVDGQTTEYLADLMLYEAVEPDDQVQVTYRKRRISDTLQVIDVTS